MRIYPQISARLFGPALAIAPLALKATLDGIGPRLTGHDEDSASEHPSMADEKRAAVHRRMASVVDGEVVEVGDGMAEYALTAGGIAVISIQGSLVNRFDWMASICGMTSYDTIGMCLDAALADPKVKAIMLDVDSPGGEASGMLDLADRIRAACDVKPIWACANSLAASAAYGLASAAQRLVLPRFATVGSIGVVAVHCDKSQQNTNRGLTYTAIYSGSQKIDGWQHAPLADDAQIRWQAEIDAMRVQFASAVASFRGLPVADVLATEAATYNDSAAVTAGLADAVQTFDSALADLTAMVSSGPQSFFAQRGASDTLAPARMEISMTDTVPAAESPANSQPAPADQVQQPSAASAPSPSADAVRAAGAQYAKDVADLCLLAGKPNAATDFMARGLSTDQVRAALLESRATTSASDSLSSAQPGPSAGGDVSAWAESQRRCGAL